jgi:hypothetical protein
MMNLTSIAKRYAENPASIDAMTAFAGAIARETSVDEIRMILPLDFERIAGLALSRLTDLLPNDIDLLLTMALWKYHFGLDEDAHEYLERAKKFAPFDLRVLQVEIFFNYGSERSHILSLCESALAVYPHDDWTLSIKRSIEQTGQLTRLNGPPMSLYWQKCLLDVR